MKKNDTAFHGSDLEKIEEAFGIKKEDIVNFAANVNPYGFSKKAAEELKNNLQIISAYPDPAYKKLKKAIADYSLADADKIILGNGVTELLTLFFKLLQPKKALIIGPTYSEYEKDLKKIGCQIVHYNAKEENDFRLSVPELVAAASDRAANDATDRNNVNDALDRNNANDAPNIETDLVILCNPNNPTSCALSSLEIGELAKAYQSSNINLLIDETYVEFAKDFDSITAAPLTNQFQNLFILRGTSKFFATPGLRLGYAITSNEEILSKMKTLQDPWNINSVAEFVGSIMFEDNDYINMVRDGMESEKEFFIQELSTIPGVKTYPVKSNLILVKLPDNKLTSTKLFEALISQGLMIRDCSSFETLGDSFIRICFMNHEDNVRLVEAIKKELS